MILSKSTLKLFQPEVGLGDAADALAFHGHDRADVEGEEAFELLHLFPGLGDVLGGALEADGVDEPLEDGAVAVQALQSGEDGGMELVGGKEEGAGPLQQLPPDVPASAFAELVVEHFEQEPRAFLLAGAGQGACDADEVIQVGGVLAEGGQPFSLDRVEVPLRKVLLCIS